MLNVKYKIFYRERRDIRRVSEPKNAQILFSRNTSCSSPLQENFTKTYTNFLSSINKQNIS